MAHYQRADLIQFDGNLPEARRGIARAVQLTEDASAPRLQRMLVQALQMRLDLRLEDAAKILEAAHREFPQEIEPLLQLASIHSASARFAEAAILLEKIVQMDRRHSPGARSTRISVRISGGCRAGCRFHRPLCRAIAPRQRGAVLQPRGRLHDQRALRRGARTIRQDRLPRPHGDGGPARRRLWAPFAAKASHDHYYQDRYLEVGTDGDFAAALGQLDQSVPYYEEAVTKYQAEGPLRAWFGLLSAARIHLEQNRPEEVLALARRLDNPWAAGLRGTSYLLLHREADAEKEFAGLRDSIGPSWATMWHRRLLSFTECRRPRTRDGSIR